MMTSAQVVETSVTTTDNSPSQDYTHPDDQTTLLHVTPGFKPFTVFIYYCQTHCACALYKTNLNKSIEQELNKVYVENQCSRKLRKEPGKEVVETWRNTWGQAIVVCHSISFFQGRVAILNISLRFGIWIRITIKKHSTTNLSFSSTFLGQVFTSLHVHDLMVDCGETSTTSITVAT